MKALRIIIAVSVLVFGTVTSRAANVDRISTATGVPVATLQAERASTGLGWGGLEKAHLLANATGQSFDSIVAQHQGGQGWGRIAHNNGVNLGRLVSGANRSSHATMHAKNSSNVHGKHTMMGHGKAGMGTHGRSATNVGRGHSGGKMTTMRGGGHGASFRSGFSGSHGMHSMGHMSGGHGR